MDEYDGGCSTRRSTGTFFSQRTRIATLCLITARLLAGVIVHEWTVLGIATIGFGILFGTALLTRLCSAFLLHRHYDTPLTQDPDTETYTFRSLFRGKKHPNFTRFTFAIAFMYGCSNIMGPFTAVYMLRDLQWSYVAFTLNVTTFMLAHALFVRWWGTIGDRHGNRVVLLACCCIIPIVPLFWILSQNPVVLLIAQLLSGAAWSGFILAAMNFIYDAIPQSGRARALAYHNVMTGLTSIIGGTLVGGWIAQVAPTSFHVGSMHITLPSSLTVVFTVSAVMRTIATLAIVPCFKEVRDVEPAKAIHILWRLCKGEPFFGPDSGLVALLRGSQKNDSQAKFWYRLWHWQ